MRVIRLYGELGQLFGREHRLAVRSPAEAVRALSCTIKGFRRYLAIDTAEQGYRVWAGAERRTLDTYGDPCGTTEVVRIAPVIAGSGSVFGTILGIIAGAALVYFSGGIGLALGGAAYGATVTAAVSSIGYGLVLGGVSSLLFKPPKAPTAQEQNTPVQNKPSFIFDGPVNTVREGNPVPLCYGRMIVGSQVISAGLRAEQIAI